MTNVSKIVLSSSRDIPFNKLVLSQANVRRILRAASLSLAALDFLASSPVEFLRYAWAEPESLEFGRSAWPSKCACSRPAERRHFDITKPRNAVI